MSSTLRNDDDAYADLVKRHRRELLAHCYRMLGSSADAEDALQETLLRAWRGLAQFEGRSSIRSWLYTIATNVCLRAIERRPKRVLPIDYGPAADPHDGLAPPLSEAVWVEPFRAEVAEVAEVAGPQARYEQRESIELAFVAALQHLPASQRAVLILRDVMGFSAAEVADALETTTAAVNSSLQRAHKAVDDRVPAMSQQATLRALGKDGLRAVVDRYVGAWQRGDVDALVGMLTEDAAITMPPTPTWFRGSEAVAAFLAAAPLAPGNKWRVVPTEANGQPAFEHHLWEAAEGRYVLHALSVLTLRGDRVAEITSFLTPAVVGGDAA